MTRQIINLGSAANDGSGDTFRDAMDKVNDNFIELYSSTEGFITPPDSSGFYVRTTSDWFTLSEVNVVLNPPSDGNLYARGDSAWVQIPNNIEAPSTGLAYARKSGSWVETVEEADSDGTAYVRQNAAWAPLPNIIADAPANSIPYVRQDSAWVSLSVATGVTEAPSNGQIYARQDSAWFDITATLADAGITDAPDNGSTYGRQSETWIRVAAEAPENGTQYVRVDATWTPLVFPVNEAPVDGVTYGRRDSSWVRVAEEADSDGTVYGRLNGDWTAVIEEAPEDSDFYVRTNKEWALLPVKNPDSDGLYLRDSSTWTLFDSASISTAIGQTFYNGISGGDAPSDSDFYVRQNGAWVPTENPSIQVLVPAGDSDNVTIRSGKVLVDLSSSATDHVLRLPSLDSTYPNGSTFIEVIRVDANTSYKCLILTRGGDFIDGLPITESNAPYAASPNYFRDSVGFFLPPPKFIAYEGSWFSAGGGLFIDSA